MTTWVFVDDQPDAAASYAEALSDDALNMTVVTLGPKAFRDAYLSGAGTPDGVLLDVELSNETGERGSGPGIAQDIRVKQRTQEIAEFPIIRFARRDVVASNIGGDTSSNDLFDLKVQKEDVAAGSTGTIKSLMCGVVALYSAFGEIESIEPGDIGNLVGLNDERVGRWTATSFVERMGAERAVAVHAAVLVYIRTFLMRAGLLIDESLLAVRLGVDSSSHGWGGLRHSFAEEKYDGVAAAHFSRWWARGIEDWWYARFGSANSLPSLTITQRYELLSAEFGRLDPLVMPQGSPGTRPWRLCELSLERSPPDIVPVDPAEGARLVSRGDFPLWVDPLYASARRALADTDRRVARTDLDRLQAKLAIP